MRRPFAIVVWGGLGLAVFCTFLYWTFPYDLVKERLIAGMETAFGGAIEVKIEKLKPHWFTGAKLKGLELRLRTADGTQPLWSADRVKVRVGLFSLLFGQPRTRFALKGKASRISGRFQRGENGYQLELHLDPLAIEEFGYVKSVLGMELDGAIEGAIRLQVNPTQLTQSQGQIDLVFRDWRLKKGSKIPLGQAGRMDVQEDLVLAKGSDAGVKIAIAKGVAEVTSITLAGGDIEMEVKGQAFLSQRLGNLRMNLNGQLKTLPKADAAFPLPKQPDGTCRIVLTGNLNDPKLSLCDFPILF